MSYLSKEDNTITLPTQEVIQIKEGFKAYHNAIEHLKLIPSSSLPSIALNVPLSFISVNEAELLFKSKANTEANTNANHSSFDRFKRYGTYDSIAEITFITNEAHSIDYESIVTQLLVSDGDAKRVNRSIVLNPEFNMIGIGKWKYTANKILIEMIFASNWKINNKLNYSNDDNAIDNFINQSQSQSQEDKEQRILKDIAEYEKAIEIKVSNDYPLYITIDEEKRLLKDNERIKLIKQYHFVLENNVKKSLMFSKSFFF